MPRWVSKALAVGPGLLVSTVLSWMVGAVLPPAAGLALFVGGLAMMVLLLCGRGESAVARVLYRAHPLTQSERAMLAPAVTLLCRNALGPPLVRLWICSGDTHIAAQPAGRHTVLIAQGVLDAVEDGQLTQGMAVAIIGHPAALVRDGWTRNDLAITFWSLPWLALKALAGGIAQGFGRLPFVALGWRLRLVVAAVAVVQACQQGVPWMAVFLAALAALTYLIPMWERRWQTVELLAGDRALVEADLGAEWASVLNTHAPSPLTRRRLSALSTRQPHPLRLIAVRPHS